MSGWMKIDKDLIGSIRFRRVVRSLRNTRNALRDVTQERDEFVTSLALGALVKFWLYADSHISEDNSLNITLDEINEIVGVEGFAQALPADWLQVVDADHVKLPDFLEHNGSSEKLRRDNARRQAAYRHRHVQRNVTRDVTASNASNDARQDKTRQDKTRLEESKNARETAPEVSRGTFELMRKLRDCYPAGTYRDASWLSAERAVVRLLDEGEKVADLVAAALAYQLQQQATGNLGTQFVLSPEKFFATDAWRGPFPTPAPKLAAAGSYRPSRSTAEIEAEEARRAVG